MKKMTLVLGTMILLMLFTGAASHSAPVMQSRGIYANDYATVLFPAHREDLLALSGDLYQKTGVQFAVLTVQGLSGLDIAQYAQAVVSGWGMGGANNTDAVLLLYDTQEKSAYLYVGENLAYIEHCRQQAANLGGSAPASSIMKLYRFAASEIYSHNGIEPDAALAKKLKNPLFELPEIKTETIMLLMMAIVAFLVFFQSRSKRRKKALTSYVYKRKKHTRDYSALDAREMERYEIKYDDQMD